MAQSEPQTNGAARLSSAGLTLSDVLLSTGLLEAIPDAVVAVNQDGIILQINSQTEEMFGYAHGELVGQNVDILVPQAQREGHLQHRHDFEHLPRTRRMGAGLDLKARRKDGSEFPVEISLSPVATNQGILVLSAIRDISDRKEIEAELRRAHEELRRSSSQQLSEYRSRLAWIVDSSEDAIIGKGLDGIITSWNKGAENIYGYQPQEAIGKSISMLAPSDRANEILDILKRVRLGESVESFETVRVAKDGRHLNMSITVSAIRDNNGAIVGASVIARNITAQKRTEQQLRQAQKMEAIGRLAGGVAHDFNNILGIITACCELLRGRLPANSAPVTYIDNIRKAADRGASLTRQLLTFSRQQAAQPRVLDLNERLKEITKLLRPVMGDDVEVVTVCRSNSALVEADPNQLDQVILNLAINARDAMPQGGRLILETASVEFDAAIAQMHAPLTAGKYVLLAVSDTGSGMDQVTVSHIFEPFFTTKEIGKGTGLGLSTVYGIVQHNGGHIWVYSETGRGTTFKLYLPSADHKIGLVSEPEPEAEIPKRTGTTLLLVEDDEMMRALTREILQEHGYAVIEAKDGHSALACIASSQVHIDVILSDVVMRGLSGQELGRRLGASHPDVKIVYMSGYTGELIAEQELLQPGVNLLEKPFTRAALLKILDSSLA